MDIKAITSYIHIYSVYTYIYNKLHIYTAIYVTDDDDDASSHV